MFANGNPTATEASSSRLLCCSKRRRRQSVSIVARLRRQSVSIVARLRRQERFFDVEPRNSVEKARLLLQRGWKRLSMKQSDEVYALRLSDPIVNSPSCRSR